MVYLWMCFFDSAWILIFWTYRQWKAERSLPWWTTWIELGRLAFSTSPISRKEIPSLLAHFLLGLLEIQHILPELTSTVPSGLQVSVCQVSSPESVLSPWLVSDAVLHLFAQIMRFTTSSWPLPLAGFLGWLPAAWLPRKKASHSSGAPPGTLGSLLWWPKAPDADELSWKTITNMKLGTPRI